MCFSCDWLNYGTDVFHYLRSYPNIIEISGNVCCKIRKKLTLQSCKSDVSVSYFCEDVA